MTKHVVISSGGLDSTVTLAHALSAGADPSRVLALTFDYGQRHVREVGAAREIARHYGVEQKVLNLGGLMTSGSLLADSPEEVPEGHYAADNMASTVVHGRNLLFASVAISLAGPGGTVWTGVHAGDHTVYPDCRPEFWQALETLAQDAYDVGVVAPYLFSRKEDIAAEGDRLGAPLCLTWSCYKGGEVHCGRCGTCVERREAFDLAGVTDPTTYEGPAPRKEAVL